MGSNFMKNLTHHPRSNGIINGPGGGPLIPSERPDFRTVGKEKWNLLLKPFQMSPRMSPNSLSFTHINFLRLVVIVGQSHCTHN